MTIVWQRIEGFVLMISALAVFYMFNDALTWWAAIVIFFAPDLSLFGYLHSKDTGAFLYNLTHIYAVGSLIALVGLVTQTPILTMSGILLFAHCGYDRALSYGLKHRKGFHFTHLGLIGKAKEN